MKVHETMKTTIIDRLTLVRPFGDYSRRFGVYFKHNTGRAVAFFHQCSSSTVTDFQSTEKWLNESFTTSHLDTFPEGVKTQFVNDQNLVVSILTEWNFTIKIEQFTVIKILRVRYRSTVVFMNTEFYFVCQ